MAAASRRRRGAIVDEGTDVESWSLSLPDSYLLCRDMGHLWRPFRAHYVDAERVYKRVLRCGRCKTERVQDVGLDGLIVSGTYNYADNYQAPRGTGRLDGRARGQLRLESTLRLIGKDDG